MSSGSLCSSVRALLCLKPLENPAATYGCIIPAAPCGVLSHQRREKWKIKKGWHRQVLLQAANLGKSSSNSLCLSPTHPPTVLTCSSSAFFHPGSFFFQVTKLRNFPFPRGKEEKHLTDNELECTESQGMKHRAPQRNSLKLLCPGEISKDKPVLLGTKNPN